VESYSTGVSDVKGNVADKLRRYTSRTLSFGSYVLCRPFVASGLAPDVNDNVAKIRRSYVASEPVSVIPAQAGIQSNNGCIQILPILWMPDQVRHDSIRPSFQPASQNATADRSPQYVNGS